MTSLLTYDALPHVRAEQQRLSAAFGIRFAAPPVESFFEWRGHSVHIDDWAPVVRQGEPRRGTVLLIHGAGGHGRLLGPFAAPLAAAGFAVRAPDLPGYGLTRPAKDRPLDFAEWVDLVAHLADEAASEGPVFLYGLSVGGLLAVFAAQKARQVSGVIATTLVDLRDRETLLAAVRMRWMGWLALFAFRFGGSLLARLALPLAWTLPIETLTTDRSLARMLVRDPLIGMRRVPLGFFRSMHTYVAPRSDFELPCPLVLVHPGADTWTETAQSMPVYAKISSPKSFVSLTNGAHAPLESPAYAELDVVVKRFLDDHTRPMRD